MDNPVLRLVRPPSLVEAAVARLTDAIVSGEFKAGQRLVEIDLAAMLGISRAPLREALRTLSKEGLVEMRRGRGAIVASPTDDEVEHMILFRALVEGAAARLIAFHRDKRVLSHLTAILGQLEEASARGRHDAFLKHVWNFHGVLCAESGNPFLAQAWGIAGNVTRLYLQRAVSRIDLAAALSNHRAIHRAVCTMQPAEAESMVRSLIIRLAYELLGREVPQSIGDYVNPRYKAASTTSGEPKPAKRGARS
ncbi:MAG: hypothetical protein QOD26_3034 [Betaproteobacteria bacterium]|jgi:DNA-binding GntR family transcriptional regulator|nr:hypothetical protein [Betaproteobacteria bacterium]